MVSEHQILPTVDPGQFGGSGERRQGFDPSQFGGGGTPGQFGGGAFGGGQASPMNESLYTDINSTLSGVAAVEPILQASEGQNVTMSMMGRSFTRLETEYTIEGIPLTSDLVNNYPVLPTNITSGRNLAGRRQQELSCLAKITQLISMQM